MLTKRDKTILKIIGILLIAFILLIIRWVSQYSDLDGNNFSNIEAKE